MAVLVEAFSVIVRREAVDAKHPGGATAFVSQVPNRTFCDDRRLARVGFHVPHDAAAYVSYLEERGLTATRDGEAVDLVVVDQIAGPWVPAPWLRSGWAPMEGGAVRMAWCVGDEPSSLAIRRRMDLRGVDQPTPELRAAGRGGRAVRLPEARGQCGHLP